MKQKKTFEEGYKKGYKNAVKDFFGTIDLMSIGVKFFVKMNEKLETTKNFDKKFTKMLEDGDEKKIDDFLKKEFERLKKEKWKK